MMYFIALFFEASDRFTQLHAFSEETIVVGIFLC